MEPDKGDIVEGWFGKGVVTDVAIGQGVCRVKVDGYKPSWTLNADITTNHTKGE